MSREFLSMTALLGLLAIAGYQNRTRSPKSSADLGSARPELPGKVALVACSAS